MKLENQQKEGDASNSFLRISASHNSKLCLECHKNKRTVLGTEHDLSISDSKAINLHGQDVTHSGVCGQCHSVHNATMETGLWAREPAKVVSDVEKMCLSCHANGKVAEDKIPPKLQHPDHITVSWFSLPPILSKLCQKGFLGGLKLLAGSLASSPGSGSVTEIIASNEPDHTWLPKEK